MDFDLNNAMAGSEAELLSFLRSQMTNPPSAEKFLSEGSNDPGARRAQALYYRDAADKLSEAKQYKDASVRYIQAATTMLGRDLPTNGPYNLAEYAKLVPSWPLVDLMEFLNGAAECLSKLRCYKQALWLAAEIEVIIRNVQMESTRGTPYFEWFDFDLKFSAYVLQRLRPRVVAQTIYRELGNTAAANERRWHSTTMVSKDLETPAIRKLNPTIQEDPVYRLRHPDPKLVATLAVTDPSLQVMGSWQKIPVKKGGGITSRMGFASFVFEGRYFVYSMLADFIIFIGHLYILGGEKYLSGPHHRDFWCIDLAGGDEWRPLPAYPVPASVTGDLVGFSMVVHEDRAFFFTGHPEVDVFNLRTHTWSALRTSFPEAWPYPKNNVVDYAMHCVRGKIYVFGGSHDASPVGCTLLMELNIAARTWRALSGTALPVNATYGGPGPRRLAASWVGKDQNTIFVMYGIADRMAARLSGKLHAAYNSHSHDDFWSWDIAAGAWTQRRLSGNVPSPRGEMACTYNAVLDKVIVFGGYTPVLPSQFSAKTVFTFSFFGDTFMYGADTDGAAPAWKHVLTHGFPVYRAQAHLVSDPASGRTFLFGGYVNAEYVPSRSEEESRSFADLWELRVNVPGSDFADVDVEEEARTARVGPWQRCFACGSAGPWKKCGGSCKGQAYFCDAVCFRDGWKEHKLKHKCRK
ncbi:hypothetical protein C8R43DRAFT_1139663 [Mycena crocata]|nr:hypothetical protein C8R43DRAFT_1139663 [Mycena crocata]